MNHVLHFPQIFEKKVYEWFQSISTVISGVQSVNQTTQNIIYYIAVYICLQLLNLCF